MFKGNVERNKSGLDQEETQLIVNRNRKLEISTTPTKARSREPAYSPAFIPNRIDRQRVRSRESGMQAGRQSDGYGGWCLGLRRGWR